MFITIDYFLHFVINFHITSLLKSVLDFSKLILLGLVVRSLSYSIGILCKYFSPFFLFWYGIDPKMVCMHNGHDGKEGIRRSEMFIIVSLS